MTRYESKKVLKYIRKGSVSKLRHFVRQNDVNLNKIRDSQGRSVLHLACYLGEGRITRCLLRCGADPCVTDECGNTPLHTALEYALEFNSESVFMDLVLPLKKKAKRVMHLRNKQGVTPDELLVNLKEAMKKDVLVEKQKVEAKENEKKEEQEEEREWMEKLAFEYSCEDFYFKDEDSPSHEETTEDYNEWADRIKREYHTKRTQTNDMDSKQNESQEERTKEETEWKKVTEKLEKDHKEYIARIQQKRKDVSLGKEKEKYEQKCAAVFEESVKELTFWEVPWPCEGSAVDIVEKLAEWADEKEKIKYLKLQRIRWHPDRFLQRCRHRIKGRDREKIMDLVKQISQGINALIASL